MKNYVLARVLNGIPIQHLTFVALGNLRKPMA